jgi:HPt (histidine-containing phosphotransfer) domain-containing protein
MIDRAKLLQMIDGDEAVVTKFIDGFMTQVQKQLPLMDGYLESENREMLSNCLHVIKTQTAYMGLDEISALAQSLERHVDAGHDLNEITSQYNDLTEKLRMVIATELS